MASKAAQRITRESPAWIEATAEYPDWDLSCFAKVPELKGRANWNKWYHRIKDAARMTGLSHMYELEWKWPGEPEESWTTEDWNDRMLLLAHYERLSRTLRRMMLLRCAPHLEEAVQHFSRASEVLQALQGRCTIAGFDIVRSQYMKVHQCYFDDFPDYESFYSEFVTRIADLHWMKGAVTIGDEVKCIIFVNALGPRFAEWANYHGADNDIAGTGKGPKVSFADLGISAKFADDNIKASEARAVEQAHAVPRHTADFRQMRVGKQRSGSGHGRRRRNKKSKSSSA